MEPTGAQWRHLPDEYGKWNSVFRRYRRWPNWWNGIEVPT
ncbi:MULTISPECIES: transposase [Brucella/Ochrobactrum group]